MKENRKLLKEVLRDIQKQSALEKQWNQQNSEAAADAASNEPKKS